MSLRANNIQRYAHGFFCRGDHISSRESSHSHQIRWDLHPDRYLDSSLRLLIVLVLLVIVAFLQLVVGLLLRDGDHFVERTEHLAVELGETQQDGLQLLQALLLHL